MLSTVITYLIILCQSTGSFQDQIDILGDDAVPAEYHVNFWKSELIDFGFIQQDSFDEVDMNTPIERQTYMLSKLYRIAEMEFPIPDFQEVGNYFKKMINLFKQMNYSEFESSDFKKYEAELERMLEPYEQEVTAP